jgi:hypothetical protein
VVVSAYLGESYDGHLRSKVYTSTVPAAEWTSVGASEFKQRVLPRVRAWLLRELAKSETELFEALQLVVVWGDGSFTEHEAVTRGRML